MKNCTECNYNFTFNDRLKSTLNGKLKCKTCNAVYREQPTIYVFLYYSFIFFTAFLLRDRVKLENIALDFILYMMVLVPILLLFNLIPHKWHRYRRIDR